MPFSRPRPRFACSAFLVACAALLASCARTPSVGLEEGSAEPEIPELVTDRPDQTESTNIVPPGSVQIESGWTHAENDDDGEEYRSDAALETLVRVGLWRDIELRLGLAGYNWDRLRSADGAVERESGWGDTEIGFKYRLWDEKGLRPEAALLAHVSLPTGNDVFSSDRLDPNFRFAFSHTLTDRLSFGYNLGGAWATEETVGGDDDRDGVFQYTATLGYSLTERLGSFIEVFGDVPASDGSAAAHSLDGGFTYKLTKNFQLDLSGGVGLSDEADDWFVGLGFAWRIPR